jgi:hypothetical protein
MTNDASRLLSSGVPHISWFHRPCNMMYTTSECGILSLCMDSGEEQ